MRLEVQCIFLALPVGLGQLIGIGLAGSDPFFELFIFLKESGDAAKQIYLLR